MVVEKVSGAPEKPRDGHEKAKGGQTNPKNEPIGKQERAKRIQEEAKRRPGNGKEEPKGGQEGARATTRPKGQNARTHSASILTPPKQYFLDFLELLAWSIFASVFGPPLDSLPIGLGFVLELFFHMKKASNAQLKPPTAFLENRAPLQPELDFRAFGLPKTHPERTRGRSKTRPVWNPIPISIFTKKHNGRGSPFDLHFDVKIGQSTIPKNSQNKTRLRGRGGKIAQDKAPDRVRTSS